MRVILFAMIVATSAALPALADTTVITDREGLAAISNDLAGTYLLAADIDLAGIEWTPLGFDNESFTGKFYGNGHVISHLVVTNHPAVLGRGLFGVTEGATVLATEDLSDWPRAVEYPVEPAAGLCLPDLDPAPLKTFFKWRMVFTE